MPLELPNTHPKNFFSANYRCSNCNHEAAIFLSKGYSFYNICNQDEICAYCCQRKNIICRGDLIWRSDWPEPDNSPWQLQCAYIPKGTGCCENCKQHYRSDYKNLILVCPICDTETMFHHI